MADCAFSVSIDGKSKPPARRGRARMGVRDLGSLSESVILCWRWSSIKDASRLVIGWAAILNSIRGTAIAMTIFLVIAHGIFLAGWSGSKSIMCSICLVVSWGWFIATLRSVMSEWVLLLGLRGWRT